MFIPRQWPMVEATILMYLYDQKTELLANLRKIMYL